MYSDSVNKSLIILIGNYSLDKQESMIRFTNMLGEGLTNEGYKVEIWSPIPFFNKLFKTTNKWLGYIDKWIIFPIIIKWYLLIIRVYKKAALFHICDHSNSPYLAYLPIDRTSITCHDVLAIRGALGYKDAYCSATRTGKILQKWILRNLKKAKRLAAVSQTTLNQLNELISSTATSNNYWRVIYNSFNDNFSPKDIINSTNLLTITPLKNGLPFLLHVGSALPRKNRGLLVEMVAALLGEWDGYVCFAGQAIDKVLAEHADRLGLRHRLLSIEKPDHETLLALYINCEAFIFPSFSEGFGWPLIEAQACGAPVIASSTAPMPEISGGAALHADPSNPQAFANEFLSLRSQEKRADLVQQGFENCKRFEKKKMIEAYLDLFGLKRSILVTA